MVGMASESQYPVFEIPEKYMGWLIYGNLIGAAIFFIIGAWGLLLHPPTAMGDLPMWFVWFFNVLTLVGFSLAMGFVTSFILITIARLLCVAGDLK